jgi:predicted Zn-dependent peptidase
MDVTLAEIGRFARGGVDAEELDMMRAGLKSSLIMQQESSMSRSSSLAADWYYLGRVRTLDEIASALDALTPESVSSFAASQDVADMTIVTLGPKALALP